jgi:hypothetical protein
VRAAGLGADAAGAVDCWPEPGCAALVVVLGGTNMFVPGSCGVPPEKVFVAPRKTLVVAPWNGFVVPGKTFVGTKIAFVLAEVRLVPVDVETLFVVLSAAVGELVPVVVLFVMHSRCWYQRH